MSKRERQEAADPEQESKRSRLDGKNGNQTSYLFYPSHNPLLQLDEIKKKKSKKSIRSKINGRSQSTPSTAMGILSEGEVWIDRQQIEHCRLLLSKDPAVLACRRYQRDDIRSSILNLGMGNGQSYAVELNSVGGGIQFTPVGKHQGSSDQGSQKLLEAAFRLISLSANTFFDEAWDSIYMTGLLVLQRTSHKDFKEDIMVVRSWQDTAVSVRMEDGQQHYQAWELTYGGGQSAGGVAAINVGETLEDCYVFDSFGYKPKIFGSTALLSSPISALLNDEHFKEFMFHSAVIAEIINSNPVLVMERPQKSDNASMQPESQVVRFADDDKMAQVARSYANADQMDNQRIQEDNEEQLMGRVASIKRTMNDAEMHNEFVNKLYGPSHLRNPLIDQIVSTYTYKVPREFRSTGNAPRATSRNDLENIKTMYQRTVCAIMGTPWELIYGEQRAHVSSDNLRNNYLRRLRNTLSEISTPYSYMVNALLRETKKNIRLEELKKLDNDALSVGDARRMREADHVHVTLSIRNFNDADLTNAYMHQMIDYPTFTNAFLSSHTLLDYSSGNTKDPLTDEEKKEFLFKKPANAKERNGKSVSDKEENRKQKEKSAGTNIENE